MASRIPITATNRGPLINIAAWVLLAIVCLATSVKVLSKWVMVHELQYDDMYMLAGMIITIGYNIALSFSVSNGLGQHISALTAGQILHFQQASYASEILYVISLCLAKMVILQFLLLLTRPGKRCYAVKGVMLVSLIMVVAAIFAVAFQCHLPHPWTIFASQCFDQRAFWYAFGVIDILIDLSTAILPVYLLYDVQLRRATKAPVMLALGIRFLIIPIIVLRLVYLHAASDATDPSFNNFKFAITSCFHVNLSIILMSIPFIKPIMDSLETGILASDIRNLAPIRSSIYPLSFLRKGTTKTATTHKQTQNYLPSHSAIVTKPANNSLRMKGPPNESEERMII